MINDTDCILKFIINKEKDGTCKDVVLVESFDLTRLTSDYFKECSKSIRNMLQDALVDEKCGLFMASVFLNLGGAAHWTVCSDYKVLGYIATRPKLSVAKMWCSRYLLK